MRRKRVILVAILTIILLVVGSIIYFVIKPDIKEEEKEPFLLPQIEEKTLEEVIKDLTPPTVNEFPEVPSEIIKDLTAPEKRLERGEISEALLEDLTVPR